MLQRRSDPALFLVRRLSTIVVALASVSCGAPALSPTTPDNSVAAQPTLDRAAVIDALDYWQSAAGITYVLTENNTEPRLLIRPGTDGLGPQGGGRGLIDGTYSDSDRARSGLVVMETGGGQYCRISAAFCRYLYRHEIGHSLGFLDHSNAGLMNATPDELVDRERRMVIALYSLPHGAQVETDGTWAVPSTGQSGKLDDVQAARDVISWNMNAQGAASFRRLGTITRWELPVRVYLQQ
jgi:hypothetical protein